MDVNLYTFVGARAPTMAQMGTHNRFWAPTKIIKAPTTRHVPRLKIRIQDPQDPTTKWNANIQDLQDPTAKPVRIHDLQDITAKQKFRIQDLQDPTAKNKSQDSGSPESHDETEI